MKLEIELTKVYVEPDAPLMSITQYMIEEMADNYDPSFRRAPIVFGHPSFEEEEALGYIENVWVEGDTLKGLGVLNEKGEQMVKDELVTQGSICYQKGMLDRDGNMLGSEGWYVMHHALLGSSNPAVADLKPLQEGAIYAKSLNYEVKKQGFFRKNYKCSTIEEEPDEMKEDEIKSMIKAETDGISEEIKALKKELEEERKTRKADGEDEEKPEGDSKEKRKDDDMDPDDLGETLDILDKAKDMEIDPGEEKSMKSLLMKMATHAKTTRGTLLQKAYDGYYAFMKAKSKGDLQNESFVKKMTEIQNQSNSFNKKNKSDTKLQYKTKFSK